jgi:hypothetical protein
MEVGLSRSAWLTFPRSPFLDHFRFVDKFVAIKSKALHSSPGDASHSGQSLPLLDTIPREEELNEQ